MIGLIGPNGTGKSTNFKMLCGLLTPTSGEGTVAGHDLRRARADARSSLGYMAQKFSLYGDLSVRQNLAPMVWATWLTIERTVSIFHLESHLTTNTGTLPLGQKQRLELACAVLRQPPVLFLDEPTSGIGPIVRREFWTHINGLVDEGVTVLITSHFMNGVEYCDEVTLNYQSRQIATGTPGQLKALAARQKALRALISNNSCSCSR